MFGNRYFGSRYFANAYFGGGLGQPAAEPQPRVAPGVLALGLGAGRRVPDLVPVVGRALAKVSRPRVRAAGRVGAAGLAAPDLRALVAASRGSVGVVGVAPDLGLGLPRLGSRGQVGAAGGAELALPVAHLVARGRLAVLGSGGASVAVGILINGVGKYDEFSDEELAELLAAVDIC